MSVSSPGPLCEELGLYGEMFLLDSIELTNPLDQQKITKGVVFELSQFCKSHKVSWNTYLWMDEINLFRFILTTVTSIEIIH